MKEKKFWKPGSEKPDEEVNQSSSKPVLSKSVLSMKFMTRKVEAEELKREENKKRKLLSDSTSWVNETSSPTVASATVLKCVEADENDFYSELPGRRSFGGFNPSIERIYSNHCESMTAEKKINKEKEIVANLDKLVSLPRGPNQGVMQSIKGHPKPSKKKNSKR